MGSLATRSLLDNRDVVGLIRRGEASFGLQQRDEQVREGTANMAKEPI